MSILGIIIATVCYIVTGVGCLRRKDYPHALVWFSYSLANVGFIMHTLKEVKGE
jgi:hypothetical protein